MYSTDDRRFAVDLWFEMLGSMSMADFVDELGWPSATTLAKWVADDPRHDPDRPQYRSKPVLTKLELISKVSGGVPLGRAAREAGVSPGHADWLVRMYAEGGTAALLPKPTVRARAKMGNDSGKREAKGKGRAARPARPAWEEPPAVPDELPDDPAALKAIIGELQLSNAVLREVLDVLKAGARAGAEPLTNREKALAARRLAGRFTLTAACAALGLARSSCYSALGAPAGDRGRAELDRRVREAFESDGESARGYRFVKEVLDRRLGRPVSEKRVRDSMRRQGLVPVYRRRPRGRYSSYAGELDGAAPNLLLRPDGTHDFGADAPNRVWVTDVTEFRLPGERRKVYLSAQVDLFDGKPLAWSISTTPDAELANSSLEMACATLAPGERPVVHSDRGCHYRWPGWKAICEAHGLTRSMSRKGRSPDNAAMEGFFGTLKNEFFHGRDWRGHTAESFSALLDAWLRRYSTVRLKAFREGGRTVYDTIDGRRRRLGFAV